MVTKIFTEMPEGAAFVRETVFKIEQGFENEFDDTDKVAVHFLVIDDGNPVATCRVFAKDKKDEYVLGRLAVMKEYRGAHLGSKILSEAEKYVRAAGGKLIRLHSQCAAQKFYESNGYEPYGETEDEEGCPHIWMKKILD